MKQLPARKRFGQNFLQDTGILEKIRFAIHPNKDDHLLEIGPGRGALTDYIQPAVKRLDLVEIDYDLTHYLKKKYRGYENIFIYCEDILNFSLARITTPTQKIRVVGNIPYNISTPLLFKLFNQIQYIQDIHFMVQAEVATRLAAQPGDKAYGRLSVMAQYFSQAYLLFNVLPTAFRPIPQVMSTVIRIVPHQPNTLPFLKSHERFSIIVKEAFIYRRKTIANALKKYLSSLDLESLQINPQKRPQDLTVEDYIKISNF